jgi:hypothetical protein
MLKKNYRTLTKEELQKITYIMESGIHQHNSNDTGIYRKNLFQAVLEYCKIKGILHNSFRRRNFQDNGRTMRGNCNNHVYSDIPLTNGHLSQVLNYGHTKGYIIDVSNRRRKFNLDNLITDGLLSTSDLTKPHTIGGGLHSEKR